MNTVLKLLFFPALFSIALHAQTLSSDVIIAKMIDAYGGEEKLKQLNDYEQVWHVETKTSDTNGTDKRAVNLPYMLKTELTYPQKHETRIVINDYGTKQFDQERIQAKGPMLDAMKLQRMRLFHPLILKEKLREIGMRETPEHYVLVLAQGSVSAEYFVSKESYFVDKVIGSLAMGGQKMAFLTRYEDYRPYHGVMVPYKEVKYAGSVNTAVMRLQEMAFTGEPRKHR